MRTVIRTWAGCVAAPLLMVASSAAQAPPPPPTPPAGVVVEDVVVRVKPVEDVVKAKPATLEQMLAEALKNNPDVRVAESKLREAEAQLHRARMQVMQKAVTLRGAVAAQEGALKEAEVGFKAAESRAKRMAQLRKNNAIDETSVEERSPPSKSPGKSCLRPRLASPSSKAN